MIIIQIDKKIEDLHAIEHDIKTRFPVFQFKFGLIPYDLTDCTVRVYGTNSLVNSFFNDLEIVNAKQGIAKLELTDTMLIKGITKMQLVIMPNSGGQLKTQIFNLINGESLVNSDAIEGSNEYKAFEEALSKIGNIDSKLESANTNVQTALSKVDKLTKEFEKIEEFNLMKTNPTFYTIAQTAVRSVMQFFAIDETTDIMYISNVSSGGESGVPESYTISRVDRNGSLLDSMVCEYGGHGTTFGLEKEGDTVYIWAAWDKTDSSNQYIGNEVTRFPYTAGKTLKLTDPSVTTFSFLSGDYRRTIADQKNKTVGTITYSDGKYRIEVRNMEEIKSGTNNVIYDFELFDVVGIQGASLDGHILYWRDGSTDMSREPDKVYEFDLKTKQKIAERTFTFGYYSDDKYEGNYREPEGCFLYTDKTSGSKSLFLPISTDEVGIRKNKIYALHGGRNQEKFQSYVIESCQKYKMLKSDGSVLDHPEITKLSDLRNPGIYRFSTAECNKITDHPGVDSAGWFVENSAHNSGTTFIQKLYRDGASKFVMYSRMVTRDDTSPWAKIQN